MANPFLVLGGIAVSVVTAGIGVLAVPGWIGAAQDSAAVNDLGNIRAAESAAILHLGEYTEDGRVLTSGELGVKIQPSSGTSLVGISADTDKAWCAATRSQSGAYFAASHATTTHARDADPAAAMAAAGCTPTTLNTVLDQGFGAFTEQYRNLAVNPIGGAWAQYSDAAIGFQASRWTAHGTYSFEGEWARFTRTTTNTSSYGFHLSGNPEVTTPNSGQLQAVVPGETYRISLDARVSAGSSGTAQLRVRYANQLNQWVTTPPEAIAISPIDGDTRTYVLTFVPPAGATRVASYFVTSSLASGGYVEATHLFVTRGTASVPYFDENTPADFTRKVEWTGPRNQSESVMLVRNKG